MHDEPHAYYDTNTEELLLIYAAAYKCLQAKYGVEGHSLELEDVVDELDPKSWKQVMKSINKVFWLKAAYEEMKAMA